MEDSMNSLNNLKDKNIIIQFLLLVCLLPAFLFSACGRAYVEYNIVVNKQAAMAADFVKRGDYDQALTMYKKALLPYENEKNEEGVIFCLERMGWLNREIGQYGEALELFRRAYPIGVRLNGDAAEIDADLGDVYMFSGDSKKALEHYQKSLTTLKDFVFKTSYSGPPSGKEISSMIRKSKAIIHARVNLGTLHYFAREYDKALENLKIAHELIKRIMIVVKHPLYSLFIKLDSDIYEGIGFCRTMMGAAYGEMGQFDKAWNHFDAGKAAFEKGAKHLGLLVNQALRYKIEFISPGFDPAKVDFNVYERFLEKADNFGALEITWRVCFEIGRALAGEKEYPQARKYLARGIDALELTRSRLREDAIKKMFAASVQDVYSQMINLLYDMKNYEEGFDYLERAKARSFLDMLAGRSVKAKKSVDPLLVKQEKEIQQKIDMVVRRLKTMRGQERTSLYGEYKRLLKERANILETIKGQSLEFAATTTVTIVPAGKIIDRLGKGNALISYFLGTERTLVWVMNGGVISAVSVDMGSSELEELVSDYREAIASQQEMLWADLGEALFNTLIRPIKDKLEGADRLFMVPSKALHYLPFSSLPLSRERFLVQDYTITILPNASSLFFIHKEVTTDRDRIFAMGNPERERPDMSLKFAESEVNTISKNFPESTLLTRKEARESVIKEKNLAETGIIHIAAHGKYNPRHPLKSALLLSKDQKDDGNLETFEIFSLTMNPRLVVLSACQSGIGKVKGGDEVQSLNRAFLYAGAGGVVASLWNVSDQSTFKLMDYFYDGLKAQAASDALKEAQIKLMKEYPSPFYWAPFYLTGGLGK